MILWHPAPRTDAGLGNVVRVGDHRVEQATDAPGSMLGSAMFHTFAIGAQQPGAAEVQFLYDRPSASVQTPAKVFTLTVTVRP